MASDDQGPCFIVIGIVIIVATFIIWFSPFFLLIGIGFFMAGICLSHQKKKGAAYTTPLTSYQQQTGVQQPTQNVSIATPQPQPPQPVKEIEKHKFCPHCGNPAAQNFCENCGAKID